MMKKAIKVILLGVIGILLISIAAFIVWASFPAKPGQVALSALESTSAVQVSDEGRWISFLPVGSQNRTAFIFYPGGRVDYRAYAAHLKEIAAEGYPVYLLKVPLSLAVFSPARAGEVISAVPGPQRWVVGGHSLGGSMAAVFASENSASIAGLILWASYPTPQDDLSGSALSVASIYATNDGLATLSDIGASRRLLPPDTFWAEIKGGNHAQFGDYGAQSGDLPADITPAQQREAVVRATLELLARVEGRSQ